MLRFTFSPKVAEIISDSSKLITFQLTVIPENRMHLSLSHHLYQSPKITLIGPTWVPLDPSLFPVLASHGYTSSQLGRWNHMIDSPMRIIRSRGRTMPQRKGVSESRSIVSDSLQPRGPYSPRNSPGKNTGVGSLSFLQGIFPTQGSNRGLLHCRQSLYQLSYEGGHPTGKQTKYVRYSPNL